MEYKNIEHLSELQNAEFHVFKEFLDICQKHNLHYFLCGGTLLGAVRHKGFIPWDDDMDIAMMRDDYEKFKAVASKELPQGMYLSNFDAPGHIWLVPRVIDNNMRFYLNNATKKKEIGAWLDILVIDGYPDSKIKRLIFRPIYLFARMLYQFSNFSQSVNINKKRPLLQMAVIKFAQYSHIEKIINPVTAGHFYEWVCKLNKCKNCKNWGMYSDDKELGLGAIFPIETFGTPAILTFEDVQAPTFEKYQEYLTYWYGDYMTPPPVNERSQHNVTKIED